MRLLRRQCVIDLLRTQCRRTGAEPPPILVERGALLEAAWTNKAMGFVVPQGRERMMGYGRFENVVARGKTVLIGPQKRAHSTIAPCAS